MAADRGVVHVVGAGLAGLSAALDLTDAGERVVVHEAAGHAGGRCRSFEDPTLGTLDNGAHVLVGANRAALGYLERLGAADRLEPVSALPFLDLATGERWELPLGPLGLRRVPRLGWRDLAAALGLLAAGHSATVAGRLGPGPALERLWRPLAVAVTNTPPESASARLLARVLLATLARGGRGAQVLVPTASLGATFVEPALDALADVHWRQRVTAVEASGGRVAALVADGRRIALGPRDRLILAVPWHAAATLVPHLPAPPGHHAIVNLQLRLSGPARLAGGGPLLGLIGGTAEWVFARNDRVTVTVSAADRLLAEPAEALAERLWAELRGVLAEAPRALPPWRLVKERRATFAQTPAALARRPGAATGWSNLFLAGDWTATGLPATIEGAIRSGRRAARLARNAPRP
jgi:hydroxysqualene dehydroxylase